jgi:hypothetical protein
MFEVNCVRSRELVEVQKSCCGSGVSSACRVLYRGDEQRVTGAFYVSGRTVMCKENAKP